ncbi:DUF3325 domain-containing protein [Acidovorax sp. CCYZU-2555]|uniref:DUF3325 domain-containing protein n=1 Tax=Acidovorax sp. CCYZU-2555 TaxID=2835042 RepID=UPI001BCEA79E|nr:DUF3325 domain-containing protein [Acidovorax sp. CCYZU-2555]MBS7776613.1 DUF3325 domain-containing protein [Acidovorax sp. CCYZU-2555]
MSDLVAGMLSLALAFAGMAALAFAMERHYEQLTGARALPPARRLRCLGAALLLVSALPCVRVWGVTVGSVAWLGFLSAGAIVCVALISAAPRWAARAAAVVGAAAVLALGQAFAR